MAQATGGRFASMKAFAQGRSAAGILLFSAGVFFFALTDAVVKWLVVDYGVGQIVFVRSVGAGAVLLPLAWRARSQLRFSGPWSLHALRVGCMIADTFSFYFATRALPLADVMTFYLAAPLIVTALAVPVLGERVSLRRWAAVIAGFVGVVIVLRPGAAAISFSALVALFGSTMYALALTVTRKLRQTHWLWLVALFFGGSGVVGIGTLPFGWVFYGVPDLLVMLSIGVTAAISFMCITKALALAPASVLSPLQYASLIWAALLGWLIFGDVPGTATIVGACIIIGSGLLVIDDERRSDVGVADAPTGVS